MTTFWLCCQWRCFWYSCIDQEISNWYLTLSCKLKLPLSVHQYSLFLNPIIIIIQWVDSNIHWLKLISILYMTQQVFVALANNEQLWLNQQKWRWVSCAIVTLFVHRKSTSFSHIIHAVTAKDYLQRLSCLWKI